MPKRLFYGWYNPEKGYLVSQYPPDSPVRPAICLESLDEVSDVMKRKRADVMWIPPLKKQRLKG